MKIEGKIVDHHHRAIFEGSLFIEDGKISAIDRHSTDKSSYIMTGLVDAHVHIESSMLTPQVFGELAVSCGTVATVSDPHEIANVLGVEGIEYMLQDAKLSPIKHFFTIPSCVPATPFDKNGATITAKDVERLAASGRFVALSEVMNVPGVLNSDAEVMAKLESAKRHHLPIDGHAPLVVGEEIKKYAEAGISTDHETISLEEGLEKLAAKIKVIIREGSAAKNYNALHPLIETHCDQLMFCTDDSHPDDLVQKGAIDIIIRKGLKDGHSIFDLLKIASTNAIEHYKLDVGNLKVGDKADFIVVNNLEDFKVERVYLEGEKVFDVNNKPNGVIDKKTINNFNCSPISEVQLKKSVKAGEAIPIIELIPNEIITNLSHYTPQSGQENLKSDIDNFESDVENNILKLVYINRYNNGTPQVTYCKGFSFRKGALASSISHDSHNIIAVGTSDKELAKAINKLIEYRGGLTLANGEKTDILPLPIAGIMSDKDALSVINDYTSLQNKIKEMGETMSSPFMTLSFLALVVIPFAKIGEKGLFDYNSFTFLS